MATFSEHSEGDASTSINKAQAPNYDKALQTQEDAQTFLNAANNASERTSLLHIGYMTVCAYILVVVFSTMDMDLLVGKGVRLPVIDVDVPIVGFYITVPYIVVLMHFNLLLQFQMLSRKLYLYRAAQSRKPPIEGDERGNNANSTTVREQTDTVTISDRVHSFPYSFYFLSENNNGMGWCVGTIVGFTILLLPLVTLLSLQFRFLAYQEDFYTWSQRMAVLADVLMVFLMWPKIISSDNTLKGYWKRIILDTLACKTQATISLLLWGIWMIWLFISSNFVNTILRHIFKNQLENPLLSSKDYHQLESRISDISSRFTIILLCASLVSIIIFALARRRYCLQGILPYLLVLTIGAPTSLALMAKGEALERFLGETNFSQSNIIKQFRILRLTGKIIFAKELPQEVVEDLRSGGVKTRQALNKVIPINLKDRALRGAELTNAVLTGADLTKANLTGAKLFGAHLEYANLDEATLDKVSAEQAHFEGANFTKARLRETCFYQADLQGAFLAESTAYFADFKSAILTGAVLVKSQLVNSNFDGVDIEAANLSLANLFGSNFGNVSLWLTDMTNVASELAMVGEESNMNSFPSSAFACEWQKIMATYNYIDKKLIIEEINNPILACSKKDKEDRGNENLKENIKNYCRDIPDRERKIIESIRAKSVENIESVLMRFCSSDVNARVDCGQKMNVHEEVVKKKLDDGLMSYACESPAIARALLFQDYEKSNRRYNSLISRTSSDTGPDCDIISFLTPEDRILLRLKQEKAKKEDSDQP
jgi:uncharacterized protein YjbI with pentapeptide repeats